MPSISIVHVFVSPGAIRFVSMRSGKDLRRPRLAEEHGVVPRVAGRGATRTVRALGEDVGEDRAHVARHPPRPQGQVQRVQTEVAHHAVLAVQLRAALPVDRLARVEVAGVQEERAHLEHAPVAALADEARHFLPSGEEGELGRAAHEQVGACCDRAVDRVVGGQVDAERLLAEKVLAGLEDGDVEICVQVVRHRAVDGLDRLVGEQLTPLGDELRRRMRAGRTMRARPGSCRRRATSSGRTPIGSRWAQRAAALANSRPISPPPTRPKRTTLSATELRQRVRGRRAVVHDRHQRAGHRRRAGRAGSRCGRRRSRRRHGASPPRCGAGSPRPARAPPPRTSTGLPAATSITRS